MDTPAMDDPPAQGTSRALRWALLLAGAAAVRLWAVAQAPVIDTDGAFYAAHAMALGRGRPDLFLSPAWPPLYPGAIALAGWALGLWPHAPWTPAGAPALFELAARLVSCAAGVLLPLPVFALARRAAGTRVAWVAALLVAFHPRLVEYSAAALTESLFTLLFVSAVAAFAWEGRDRDGRPALAGAALAGALLGLAFLARTEALVVLGGLVVADVWPRARRPRPARALLLLAIAAAFVLPFVLFVHGRTGAWSAGEKSAYNFWRTYAGAYDAQFGRPLWLARRMNNGPEIAAAAPAGVLHAGAFAARHPGLIASLWARQLGENVVSSLPAAAYFPIVALALFGWRRVRRRPLAGALVSMALLVVTYSLFTRDRRFFVPFVPFVLVWAAAGLVAISARFARTENPAARRRALGAACACACVAGLAYTASVALRAEGAPEHLRAAAWVRAQAAAAGDPQPVVMARKPWVAYYAGGVIAELPDLPPERLVRLAHEVDADYVIADVRALGDRPQLGAWLAPGGAPWPIVHEETSPLRLVVLDARARLPEAARP